MMTTVHRHEKIRDFSYKANQLNCDSLFNFRQWIEITPRHPPIYHLGTTSGKLSNTSLPV